jgi:tripartite-type tricarboxylate transporter receptor subunit TctC
MMLRGTSLVVRVATILAVLSGARAEDWPSRPVTLVVPFAAGGPVDVTARLLAPRLGEVLGQSVIVENVGGGAGGMTGSSRVAHATPDGYQFVLGNIGTHAMNQSLYRQPLYNAATDFAPVSLTTVSPKVLVVRRGLPVGNFTEFAAYVRAHQAEMQFGSAGGGSATHMACVLLNALLGVSVTHVPYRGSGQAMQDLIGERIDYMCDAIQTALPQIQEKTVKSIAVLSPHPAPLLPDLPTMAAQGFPDFDVDTWQAIFLPKDTPAPIVRRLNEALGATLDTPVVRTRLEALGLSIVPPERRGPDYLAGFVRSEIDKWAAPIRASGITAE